MVLVAIENNELLSKMITHLDENKILNTTNYNEEYNHVIISTISNKSLALLNTAYQNKKSITFLLYELESKIYKASLKPNKQNNLYLKKIEDILKKCSYIIVSLPIFKEILSKYINYNKIIVVEKEIPIISKKNNKKKNNSIIVFDPNYQNLDMVNQLAITYPKYKIKVIGYKNPQLLNKKNSNILKYFSNNVLLIKYYIENIYINECNNSSLVVYCDDNIENIYINECNNSSLVVYCDDNIENIKYLYMLFLLKKKTIIKDALLYNKYLINSKNSYLYKDTNDLLLRIKKIFSNRVSNLTLESYELIKYNKFKEIGVKLSKPFH